MTDTFGFGQGDDFVYAEAQERRRLLNEIPVCPLNLYLHQMAFWLEGFIRTNEDPEMPENYRKIHEMNERRGEYGNRLRAPLFFAKFEEHWYVLAMGQGTGILNCTASEDDLWDLLERRPWAANLDEVRAGTTLWLGSEFIPRTRTQSDFLCTTEGEPRNDHPRAKRLKALLDKAWADWRKST